MKPLYKSIDADESRLFKIVVEKNEKEFEYPWHYHPEYELTYIQSSHGVRYVGNSIENFFDDDLVLIGSNLPHCWISAKDQVKPANATVMYLKNEFMDDGWIKSSEFKAIRNLLLESHKGIKFDKEIALKLKKKCSLLNELPPFEKFIGLIRILQELARTKKYHTLCKHGFTYELNQAHNERINKVYKYIETHYHKRISLSEIAGELNMCEEYFSRFFSKLMKKPFFEFLNEYKINKACKLLIETDKQISEVCYASGFESIPFFYRQFKKFKNCQPKNYKLDYQRISD